MSAANQPAIAVASTRIKNAVRAPTPKSATSPAAPTIPAPIPADLPFSRSSALASSISWRTSAVLCSESSRINSGNARSSPAGPLPEWGACGSKRWAMTHLLACGSDTTGRATQCIESGEVTPALPSQRMIVRSPARALGGHAPLERRTRVPRVRLMAVRSADAANGRAQQVSRRSLRSAHEAGASRKTVLIALAANACIAVVKLAGGLLSGSTALLAEAAHSCADTANQAFLLVSIKLSQREPTERQPFGYGHERFLWTFMAAIGMFLAGAVFAIGYGVVELLA